jgi:hypothetical protein
VSIAIPSHLSNEALTDGMKRLAGGARAATAELIAHLAEFDTRRLHLEFGYSSLFVYCCEVLRLSEAETYNRLAAAAAARRFPVILDLLASGAVTLTAVRLLSPILTEENHERLLTEATGRSRVEVEGIVAREAPKSEVQPSVRKVPVRHAAGQAALLGGDAASHVGSADPAPTQRAAPPPRSAQVQPLAPGRYHVHFRMGADMREKLHFAQDMLGHAVPSGDLEQIFGRALSLLVDDLAAKKFAATDRPRPPKDGDPDSREIPATVQRVVWVRDLGRCTYVGPDGRRCDARARLEFHHDHHYACGGPPTAANIRLLCRAHNQLEARKFFGEIRELRARVEEGVRVYGSGGPTRPRTKSFSPEAG